MKVLKIIGQFAHLSDALKSQQIFFYPEDYIESIESDHQRKGLFKYLVTESNDILYVTDAFPGSHSQEVHRFTFEPQLKEPLSAICCFSSDMDKLYITSYNRDCESIKQNCVIFTNDEL
jgi:hypothetical protein